VTQEPPPTPMGRCRLALVTDWGVGFQLTPTPREPLPDVPPGGEYQEQCTPQRPIGLYRIVVLGFHLVEVQVGATFVPFVLCDASDDHRWYRPEPDGEIEVVAGQTIRLYLRNETDAPRKPKIAMLVQEQAS
jgi:hypothetical protein